MTTLRMRTMQIFSSAKQTITIRYAPPARARARHYALHHIPGQKGRKGIALVNITMHDDALEVVLLLLLLQLVSLMLSPSRALSSGSARAVLSEITFVLRGRSRNKARL